MRYGIATLFLALLCGGTSACSATGEYTKTTKHKTAERKAGCDFVVVSSRPDLPYEKIGVIDINSFAPSAMPKTEASFRRVVAKHVCKAGGEGVIPAISGTGRYVHATVIRFCRYRAPHAPSVKNTGHPETSKGEGEHQPSTPPAPEEHPDGGVT